MNYYNENDPKAAAWLKELVKSGCVAEGVVDERSILDVKPAELTQYAQCHFFAGIGVWSYALRLAGVPDDYPVWTGSCPCQPFSKAGKKGGFDDERHLWPYWFWLIQQCKPDRVFGEQVAGKAGEAWLDLVQDDLEAEDYAVGSAVTAACGFGAPHQRKRIYWVADSQRTRVGRGDKSRPCPQGGEVGEQSDGEGTSDQPSNRGSDAPVRLADADGGDAEAEEVQRGGKLGQLAQDECPSGEESERASGTSCSRLEAEAPAGFWSNADWLFCRDGKWRPVEPGSFPLADGTPARMGRLRGYGNAIVSEQAKAFIESYFEAL